MASSTIKEALEGASAYLSEHPDEARATDSEATATMEEGLRCVVRGPDEAEVTTDMVAAVGGANSAPSPGWLARAATASCVATLIAMHAATEELELTTLEVTVDSESDDLGILGIKDDVPSGPLSVRIKIKIGATNTDSDKLRDLAANAERFCPVSDLTRRSVPVDVQVSIA
jgi:uncharacterized OsmC-like protein